MHRIVVMKLSRVLMYSDPSPYSQAGIVIIHLKYMHHFHVVRLLCPWERATKCMEMRERRRGGHGSMFDASSD